MNKWEQLLPTVVTIPRPAVDYREPVLDLELQLLVMLAHKEWELPCTLWQDSRQRPHNDSACHPQGLCWLDSTVTLHWICGNGQYKQFVDNRVNKIHQ